MTTFQRFLFLSFVFLSISCNKKGHSETDNLFKFKDYISYNTYGNKSISTDIRIGLIRPLQQFEKSQELSMNDYLEISPKVEGRLVVENSTTLIFFLKENLNPDTEYSVTVKLDKLDEDLPNESNSYTVSIHTLAPNFTDDVGKLQSYEKQWQYLEACVEASAIITLHKAQQLVPATLEGNNLALQWPEEINN